MTSQHSFRQRLRYRFDSAIAKGTSSVVWWLGYATIALILLAAFVLVVFGITFGDDKLSLLEASWQALVRTLDPGVVGADFGWPFRVVGLLVTLGGIFIVSTLIGLLANGISEKLDELRKGRSPVLEENHTLILGWSPKLLTIISELMIANENQSKACIVVMAPEDKVFMEDEIRSRVEHKGNTRIVCRTGNPADTHDLELVNPSGSRAIIVLSPLDPSPDAQVIKTVLALMHKDPGIKRLNVVAELTDARNSDALKNVTDGRISTVVSSDIIARVTAQVCRQSGLSVVYQELLDFDGDEIYFSEQKDLVGKTFRHALLSFPTSSVIGVRRANGECELNPPMDGVFQPGDSVIAISEDDDTVTMTGSTLAIADSASNAPHDSLEQRENVLVMGWNALGPQILHQLDGYVAPGSTVHVEYDPEHVQLKDLELVEEFSNLEVSVSKAKDDVALRALLEETDFDHVIVLCYRHGMSVAEADARTLMTLLQLRRLLGEVAPDRKISIVTELLDVADVNLATVANPDDFIVSEQLVSLMLAQIAENRDLDMVFGDLFDSDRSEIVLRPVASYLQPSESQTFGDAVAAAAAFGESAIGYRRASNGNGAGPSIAVNPPKSEVTRFSPDDQLIVLSHH